MEDSNTGKNSSSPFLYVETNEGNNSMLVPVVCYAPIMSTKTGVWLEDSFLTFPFPLFLFQCLLIIATTRAIDFLLRPLRQPRYISEIVGGFVLSSSVMGQIPGFSQNVFPLSSLLTLDGVAHLGLIYYIFVAGIQMDVDSLRAREIRPLGFAAACMLPPLAITWKLGAKVHHLFGESTQKGAFLAFLGVAVIVTAFSVLARILAEMKLIGSDVGRISLSSASLTNSVTWMVLATAMALAREGGKEMEKSIYAMVSGVAFYVACRCLVRPVVVWLARQTPEGEEVDELHMCGILVGVMAAAFTADAIGMHAIYGAFLLGLMVPNGQFGEAIADKVEDLVMGLMMPLFLVLSGIRTDLSRIQSWQGVALLVLMVFASVASKVAASVLVAAFYKMPLHDGVTVGLLANCKGVTELVLLDIAKDSHIIEDQTYTILVLMSVLVTVAVSPLMTKVVKPVRRLVSYKRRTIWWSNPDSELRILACVHTPRQVPALISLLDISHPTKSSPIFVCALHLVELTGRTAALLVVNSAAPTAAAKDHHHQQHIPSLGRIQAQSDAITHAFVSYEQRAGGVTAQCLTAFSPYATMHEDVFAVGEDRHAAFIVLPFHMHQTVDGGMEVDHRAIRGVNEAILTGAPCSIGILVDRGLGASGHRESRYRVAVLFFGGPDDREALAFAARMVGHPRINLTVVRFVYGDGSSRQQQNHHERAAGRRSPRAEKVLTIMSEEDRERQLDEERLREFRARWGGDMVEYEEVVATNAEETMAAMKRVDERGRDLFVVGMGHGLESPLTEGMNEWSEFPELGPIGDLLASADFEATASVLVVQQTGARGGGPAVDMLMSPDSPGKLGRPFGNKRDGDRA
ncbi:cation/H(+) antiporter 15-like [Elaeis guineensis]|uniref:Cation/H(+) antiporter 15-like n=1 Tax=Elaeis guineensis var. tenera TaxID=51953 RepID=A0A6I9RS34_ELAGV|nr:cation/H(+) antiporter 15-like [Elaeis guineensis]